MPLIGPKRDVPGVILVNPTTGEPYTASGGGGGGDMSVTEGLLDDILTKLSADPATQTTLAAILAKIIAAPATEAKQDSAISLLTAISNWSAGEYETVAASQTDQVLGATGAAGDFLSALIVIPATTAAGVVSIKDGSGSAISVFAGGGTTALVTLIPFTIPLGLVSTSGAWSVTTGANVSVIAVGAFT